MENASSSTLFTPSSHGNATWHANDYRALQRIMHTLSMVVYGVACLLGVTGNGLVIWIATFRMKRTVNAVWFLNLAVADFIFTFFLPLSIAYTALGFHWPFGKLLCKLNSTIAFLNMFASVFLLTVISVDRCASVVHPVWSRNYRTPRLASGIALVAWTAAFALSAPYLVFRDTAMNSRHVVSCYNNFALSSNYDSEEARRIWKFRHRVMIVTRFLFGFLVPFLVILVCYGLVVFRMKKRHLAKSGRPFRIIFAVTGSFFLCYFPYHVFSLLEMSRTSSRHGLKVALYIGVPLASSLAFFNSCVNPILYVFVGQKTFRKSILSAFEGAFGEDSLLSTWSSKRKSRSVSQAEIQMPNGFPLVPNYPSEP
ncbi:chemerin-like receptor 1 [Paroedura picta]|uniref:chemerin-like receptor 1 n=1 Tax=Paroedura picta TaxID=143630 RepID=UPI001015595F